VNDEHPVELSRRQAFALLTALGVSTEALAQDAVASNPRAFSVVLENERVRVLEFRSRPGLGICGQGMHSHPAIVTISLTGAKVRRTSADGKVTVAELAPGQVFFSEPVTHSAEVIGGADTRTYMIELKDKDWKPSTG
jgi:hypothetical protein